MKDSPNELHVAEIVRKVRGEAVVQLSRFAVGSCHYVYDVLTESRRKFVVRIAKPENRDSLRGAIYWSALLRPKGVPLPEILHFDLDHITSPFPYLIIERFAGHDLGIIYTKLSKLEKMVLAKRIVDVQEKVGTLPLGRGFGFAGSLESASFRKSWVDVLYASLERSRKRIETIGVLDSRAVDRVEERIGKYENYFSRVRPKGFLDDATTKNVIVHNGKLSGIVDVDCVCFGDSLFTIALTRMSLLNTNFDLDYIDYWCEAANLTDEQQEVLQLYTALFCVDFMGELGQTFNKERQQKVEVKDIRRLTGILEMLLKDI